MIFPHTQPWIALFSTVSRRDASRVRADQALIALAIATVLGLGVLLPGEARIYLEMVSTEPDPNVISYYRMYNAKLSAVQRVSQLVIIVVMVYIRWGRF